MSSLDGAVEQAFAHGVGSEGVLPRPSNQRWQPLRLGLVDLFYYDDEQFWFHDGRLLLRGNNGTGKSKVLALTLPFLLDGSIAPRRVEPDADPKKRMEWNLLLGGHPQEPGANRLLVDRVRARGRRRNGVFHHARYRPQGGCGPGDRQDVVLHHYAQDRGSAPLGR